MKNKTILTLFAIFLIAGSVAAVCAADASLGNLKFAVPDDYKVTDSNATSVHLTNDKKEILITTDIVGNDSVNSYLSSKGFKCNDTQTGNTSVKGTELNGQFSFISNTYSKDKGYATAYFLNKDNKNITVIGIDNDFDSKDAFATNDLDKTVEEVSKQIMLRK